MPSVIKVLCWPCMAVGLLLFAFACSALAAEGAVDTLTWRDLGLAAVGLVVALIGLQARSMQDEVSKLGTRLQALSDQVNTRHPDELRVEKLIQSNGATVDLRLVGLEVAVRAVHRRLDYLKVPSQHEPG